MPLIITEINILFSYAHKPINQVCNRECGRRLKIISSLFFYVKIYWHSFVTMLLIYLNKLPHLLLQTQCSRGQILTFYNILVAYQSDCVKWGINCLPPLKNWGHGFESFTRHECLCAFIFFFALYLGWGIPTEFDRLCRELVNWNRAKTRKVMLMMSVL